MNKMHQELAETRHTRRIAQPIIVAAVLGAVACTITSLVDRNGWLTALGIILSLEAVGYLTVAVAALHGHLCPPKRSRKRIRASMVASSVRESWKVMPKVIQPWLTRVSGKPLVGEAPAPYRPGLELAGIFFWLTAGVALSCVAMILQGWGRLLFVPGWIIATAQMRTLALTVLHFSSHNTFTGMPRIDNLLGQMISVVLAIENYSAYKAAHPCDHHGSGFMTEIDPTVKFQRHTLGLWPGMSREECWAAFLSRMISPKFHLQLMLQRLYENWDGATLWHRIGTVVYLAVLIVIGHMGFAMLAVCWLVPLIIFYNISMSTRPVFEHHLPPPEITRIRSREGIAACTHAIFFGSPAPSPDLPWHRRHVAWAGWWLGLLLWHWPMQAVFCPYPAQVHDLHHRHPDLRLEPCHLYTRQAEVETGKTGWPALTEIWGLFSAIDECFCCIGETPSQKHQPYLQLAQ